MLNLMSPTKQAKSQWQLRWKRQQWQGTKTPSCDRMERKHWEKPWCTALLLQH